MTNARINNSVLSLVCLYKYYSEMKIIYFANKSNKKVIRTYEKR